MSAQLVNSLGMKLIFALIEAPGEFLSEVKSVELKRVSSKITDLRERYARLEKLLQLLSGQDALRRTLRDLYAHIPKLSLPLKQGTQPYALHEFFLLKEWLYHYANLHTFIRSQGWMDQCLLPDLKSLFTLLDAEGSGLPSFRISSAYSAKLGELLTAKLQMLDKLRLARADLLEEARSELHLPQLKEEFVFSRSDTSLAEVILHSHFFVLSSESVANYSFILADDDLCLELKKQLNHNSQQLEKEETHVLKELSRQVNAALPLLHSTINTLAQTGWRFLLADFALSYDCCIPKLIRKPRIRIKAAVNLPLKLHLENSGRRYQSVDYTFDQPVSLLTGPNMGGKTTILKTLGQLCFLASLGIPLPCQEAELPLFEQIWYNQDDASSNADLSSFGREVVAFTQALQAESFTLFLLDEFARGTNPAEGELLASAVLRHLSTTGNMCIAATHFTAPAMLGDLAQYSIGGLDTENQAMTSKLPISPSQRLKVLSEAMDYHLKRLKKNQAPPHNAIRIARILGLPEAILKYTETEDK